MNEQLSGFMSGVFTAGFLVIAAFFLRFWSRTKESLFLIFSIAFVLLAANTAALALLGLPDEERSNVYLLRAAGFGLIIVAIIAKNWRRN